MPAARTPSPSVQSVSICPCGILLSLLQDPSLPEATETTDRVSAVSLYVLRPSHAPHTEVLLTFRRFYELRAKVFEGRLNDSLPGKSVSFSSPVNNGLRTEGWFLKNSGGASFLLQYSSSLPTPMAMKSRMC